MKPEKQRTEIAEACGWKYDDIMRRKNPLLAWMRPDGDFSDHCPDFVNDLNAMHEAESCLAGDQVDSYLGFLLEELELPWRLVRATATQKSKAFLRAKGKWTE